MLEAHVYIVRVMPSLLFFLEVKGRRRVLCVFWGGQYNYIP